MSFLNVMQMTSGDPRHAPVLDERRGRYKVLPRRESMVFWSSRRVRSTSLLEAQIPLEAEESTWLLTSAVTAPDRRLVEQALSTRLRRVSLLYLLPTSIVLLYSAIPFPLYPSARHDTVTTDFWFFLFVFYGIYNAVGLLYITKLFNLISVNWWPEELGVFSFVLFWSTSIGVGSLLYLIKDDWGTWTLTWSMLTLCTLCLPIIAGFLSIHRVHLDRTSSRGSLTLAQQKRIPFLSGVDTQMPQSYKRFLWFLLVLAIGLGSFAMGEAYAYLWLSTLPHTSADVLIYVYGWVACIYILDSLTAFIIQAKIECYPLSFMFRLYYALTHQIYVRNLYARLRSPQQFAVVQGASSFITVIVAPVVMTSVAHRSIVLLTQSDANLEDYRKNSARGFYLKTWAANTTMLAFLGWITILHFGGNKEAFPYYDFAQNGEAYSWELTFIASGVVWCCEIVSAWLARCIMQYCFELNVDKLMQKDLKTFPDLLPSGIILTVFVLMNILMSTVHLSFH
jgi:hypothetical protein